MIAICLFRPKAAAQVGGLWRNGIFYQVSTSHARFTSLEAFLEAKPKKSKGFKGHDMLTDLHPLVIERSEGSYVYDINEKKYFDAAFKLESKMNLSLQSAVKENDRVYLMRVLASNSLSTLPAASLIKSTPIGEITDASKDRLFASLAPDSCAKALPRYMEMVDDVIRTRAEKLQQGSEIIRLKLKEMGLLDHILTLEGSLSLLFDHKDVEAVLISGGPFGLEDEL